MAEKSILEQALLQVQTLEEAVKQNAKGILASTMKEELNELLKESEEEEEVQADESTQPGEVAEQGETTESEEEEEESTEESSPEEEEEEDMSEQPDPEDSGEEDSEDEEDLDNDEEDLDDKDVESMDSSDLESDMDSEDMGSDMGSDDMGLDDMGSDDMDDTLDMTGAPDEEVMKVFKAMGPDDGVVVKKDGDNVELSTGEDDFIIKLNEDEASEEVSEEESTEEEWNESEEEEEETIYEIELDETEEEEEESTHKEEATESRQGALKGLGNPVKKEPKEGKVEATEARQGALKGLGNPVKKEPKEGKVEATEAARTKSNPHGDKAGMNRAGLKSKKMYKAGSGVFNEEVETLKKQNAEYKKALVLFKEKLNEVAVFNANLAYATRLFTEHSTTKQEKMDILKRFDSISTLNESKSLYNTIKSELGVKKPVTESVVDKISSTPTTSSSEVLSESRVYENPQFRRMKDLMGKIK